jgi:hypothetical protein
MEPGKKPPIVSDTKAPIHGVHFIEIIREKLKEFYPKHLSSPFYLLDKYILEVTSGHITSMECVLKKNPEVVDDEDNIFYEKERTIKLSPEQFKVMQAEMDSVLIASINKKVQIVNTGGKPEITWERGAYTANDSTAIAAQISCKIEFELLINGKE